jgi:hypothetical protein
MKYVLQPGEIISNKFGIETKLQYLSEAGYKGKGMRYINILCTSCNTEHIKQFASIRAGYITSCGNKSCKISIAPLHKIMYTKGDSISSNLIYLEEDLERTTSNHRYFKVQCSCGEVFSTRVDRKKDCCTKCSFKKKRETFTDSNKKALINSLFQSYKKNATLRGYSFALTDDVFESYLFSSCYYCGVSPTNKIQKGNKSIYYNGIDRKDNSLGYESDNCVTCCGKCNMMKNKYSHDEFIQHIQSIINNLKL